MEPLKSERAKRSGASRWLFALLLVAACTPPDERSPDPRLDVFAEDALVSGKVLENVTACEVDAVCFLRVEFADTSLVALYGTGERPAPRCTVPRDVSDMAWQARPGEVVSLVVSRCADEGYFLRQLALGSRTPP